MLTGVSLQHESLRMWQLQLLVESSGICSLVKPALGHNALCEHFTLGAPKPHLLDSTNSHPRDETNGVHREKRHTK